MIPILDSMTKKIEKMFHKLLEFSIKSHTRKKRISRLTLRVRICERSRSPEIDSLIPRLLKRLQIRAQSLIKPLVRTTEEFRP